MAPDDDIRDPRAFRWVETGVSGLARQREWDATAIADVPALAGSEQVEVDFRVLGDGSVVGDVSADVLGELTRELGVAPPYAARAVRQNEREWMVGALRIESQLVDLPSGVGAFSLEAAVPPEGETMYLVDGGDPRRGSAGGRRGGPGRARAARRRAFSGFRRACR